MATKYNWVAITILAIFFVVGIVAPHYIGAYGYTTPTEADCANNIDDNGNGKIDCQDITCAGRACGTMTCPSGVTCTNTCINSTCMTCC